MRIDSFFFSFCFLVASLMTLVVSDNPVVCDISYVTALLSAGLFTGDDWLDIFFMKAANLFFSFRIPRFEAVHGSSCTKSSRRIFQVDHAYPLKARQRWSSSHAGQGIRYILRHRKAF